MIRWWWLENIFPLMEMGVPPREAAEKGGMESRWLFLPDFNYLRSSFFPSPSCPVSVKHLHSLALGGWCYRSLLLTIFAMTVVPLFCGYVCTHSARRRRRTRAQHLRFSSVCDPVQCVLQRMLERYEVLAKRVLVRPGFHRRGYFGGRHAGDCVPLSVSRPGVFPAHRSRTICYQCPDAERYASGRQQPIHRQSREDLSARQSGPRIWG